MTDPEKPSEPIDLEREIPLSAIEPPNEATRQAYAKAYAEMPTLPAPPEEQLSPIRPRSGTPLTDSLRRYLANASPEQLHQFADTVNAFAAGMRVVSAAAQTEAEEPDLPTGIIDFATFLKIDLRVGNILSAQHVPKGRNLLKLEVDFGELGHASYLGRHRRFI